MTAGHEAELRRLAALDALEVVHPPAPDTGPGMSIDELRRWSIRGAVRSQRPLLHRLAAPLTSAGGVALVVLAFERGLG